MEIHKMETRQTTIFDLCIFLITDEPTEQHVAKGY